VEPLDGEVLFIRLMARCRIYSSSCWKW